MKCQNQNRPSLFPARCRTRRLNLALVFLCLFCVVVHFFWLMNACFCCVRFSFFIPSKMGLRTSPKWPVLCRVGRKNHNSVNQNETYLLHLRQSEKFPDVVLEKFTDIHYIMSITFRVSRIWREMCIGHARLSVCLSVPHHIPTAQTWMWM